MPADKASAPADGLVKPLRACAATITRLRAELEEARGLLEKHLSNLDALDDYMKQPERGSYDAECAVCMGEWIEPDDRAVMEQTRAFLTRTEPRHDR